MPEAIELTGLGNGSIVAPAGHGKTELIASIATLGQRALILTHTHAGVHAIRSRLKRMTVSKASVSVDTIAGWCMRYAHAFPGAAMPPADMPRNGAEWDQLYRGTLEALRVGAIREVVCASYDRILVDEYQDCNALQHALTTELSTIVPTLIFGDPMQGIFEFAGATLSWPNEIHPQFPLEGTLEVPHRWQSTNPELGKWIAETRVKLLRGDRIDLAQAQGLISYRVANDAFDMGAFFDHLEGKEGAIAAIHCNKGLCYRLASAAAGGYQAIEEIAANRLSEFAVAWDQDATAASRQDAIVRLLKDSFLIRKLADGEAATSEDEEVSRGMREVADTLGADTGVYAAAQLLALARKHSKWKLYRNELWRDAERTVAELAAGRAETMVDAAARIRQRASITGRRLPKRTVSTPLLLKGLEFDHVVIPDATHFVRERQAQAKLFYVAISRATKTLTIASSERYLQFPTP
jgi:hypothetical protein